MKYMFLLSVFIFLSVWSKSQNEYSPCLYIAAESGLKVRAGASKSSEVIGNLPYAAMVQVVTDSADFKVDYVQDEGKKIAGHWVKINFDERFNSEGYVFDAFLTPHLKVIPKNTLYYFNNFVLSYEDESRMEEHIDVRYSDGYLYGENSMYLWDACIPRYIPNFTEPHLEGTTSSNVDFIDQQLKEYIELEWMEYKPNTENYLKSLVKNPYKIERNLNPYNSSEIDWKNKFYVPIQNGKDSVLVEDYDGEGYVSRSYLGEIQKLGIHLIVNAYEDIWVTSLDKETGEIEYFSSGIPFFSPNKKHMISFYEDYIDESASINIWSYDENGKLERTVWVSFKTWMPNMSIVDSFWISDDEFILQAFPIDNSVVTKHPSEDHMQWIKIRIK